MSASNSKTVIYAAIAANVLVGITKFVAAAFTGSSAMVAEGLHSIVDTANGALLLFGAKRSARPADAQHPFGHGQELYFWSFVVAVLIFGVGGGMSFYEGIEHIKHPQPISDPFWNYIVLGVAMLFNGVSFAVAWREFGKERNGRSVFRTIREAKDPSVFTIVFEDAADVVGLILAFLGVFLGHHYNNPTIDGIASIAIGVLLTAVSVFLAIESKGLLTGERAEPEIVAGVRRIASADRDVLVAGDPITMHFGPNAVLLALGVEFRHTLLAPEVAAAVDRMEAAVRAEFPVVRKIFIEAKTAGEP